MFKKTVKMLRSVSIFLVIFGVMFSNIPFNALTFLIDSYKNTSGVVDEMWLLEQSHNSDVVDNFRSLRDVAEKVRIKEAQAAIISQYTGGLLVYADGTAGTPKYKVFDDATGFGVEQSASSVGASAINWIRVAAAPTRDEWIIATRDAANVIKAQVCTGIDGGVSCGTPTTIMATAGTHGFRNYDVAYEQASGEALLVYGTANVDELRKIEWNGASWLNDAVILTNRTAGTVEWVELTSRSASNQIGIAYSDDADIVSAYRWDGTAAANEATGEISLSTSRITGNVRKFDVSFEGASGDMLVAAAVGTADMRTGQLAGSTWIIGTQAAVDMITASVDLQEPNPSADYISVSSHGVAAASNPSEGYAWTGSTISDGTAGDDAFQGWAANYQLSATAYLSTTYYGVTVHSSGATTDDIDWWTMNNAGAITDRTVNTRTRGATRFIDLFDYPSMDKVLLLTADANSDLWADTWNGSAPGATSWTDLTSGGALETALSIATKDVVDFAFRLAPPPNNPPSITISATDSPDPVSQGNNVTFSATATDSESNNWYLAACTTNAVTPGFGGGAPTCNVGTYCVSGSAVASGSQNTCAWTSSGSGAQNWYAFACDNNSFDTKCSSVDTVNSPITVTTGPDATSFTNQTEGSLSDGARIGQTIRISGSAFGSSCSSPNTVVKIGIYTVPCGQVVSWSANQIDITLDSGIDVYGGTGTSGLIVRSGGTDDPSPLDFYVYPDITSTTPGAATGAKEGDSITVSGTRFGSAGGTLVFQNCAGGDVDATPTGGNWTDTSLAVTVPSGIADNDDSCDIKITRAAGTGSKTDTLTGFVILPNITSINPHTSIPGNNAREFDSGDGHGLVRISGNHFGSTGAVVQIVSINTTEDYTTSSSDPADCGGAYTVNCIRVQVPITISDSLYTGNLRITRNSDSKYSEWTAGGFRILPRIISNTPSSGVGGDVVRISGNHFCQTETCPVSPNRNTASNNVQFGSTPAIESDFVDKTPSCGGADSGAAWTHTDICVKVPSGTPIDSQPTKVTTTDGVTTRTSNTKAFSVATTVPNNPDVGPAASKGQFKSDGSTAISIGGGTNQTTVVFKMEMSGGTNMTIEPQVEVDPVGTAFAADNISAGTPVSYSGTPVTGTVTVSGLGNGLSFHWRARVRNTGTNEYSSWVVFGGNNDGSPADTDFYTDASAPTITVGPSATPLEFSATIDWTTDESATSTVNYGPTQSYGFTATGASGTSHSVSLSGLNCGTTYNYEVVSVDGLNNTVTSSNSTFSTSACVTRIMRTIEYQWKQELNIISGVGGNASDTYNLLSAYIKESDSAISSSFVIDNATLEFSGVVKGTGGNPTANIKINSLSYPTAVSLPNSTSPNLFQMRYNIPNPNTAGNIYISPRDASTNTVDYQFTNVDKVSALSIKLIVTYYYVPL